VVWDLPLEATRLDAGASGRLPGGTREGVNDSGQRGWDGPCPPIGRHRYLHKLYALDRMLGELRDPTKAGLLRAMEGHVLASAELVGTYERTRRR
jgi:Raf kinase inhibitor-like YbhB/YbcL family protein